MTTKEYPIKRPAGASSNTSRLDQIVAEARASREQRERDYRERSLKIHPWVCARCGRVFTRENLHELTVHHKDHNHDNNPPDGSNWENLCNFCHEDEHARYGDRSDKVASGNDSARSDTSTYQPFADLKTLLKGKEDQ